MNLNKQISFQFSWCMHAQSLNHVWLYENPMDCGLPESFVHGILQARILEWIVFSFAREASQPRECSCALAGGFFTNVPPGKSPIKLEIWDNSGKEIIEKI